MARSLPFAGPGVGPLRAATGVAFGLTLALLPFESLFFATSVGGVAITELELATDLTLILWVAVLVRERRLPGVPWLVAAGVAGLVAVSLLSALLAGPQAAVSLRFVARSVMFWLLFLAAADLVRTDRVAVRLLAWALGGAAVSAAIGWIAFARGTADGLLGFGRDFTVGATMRVAGTFDYPNTAAMAWEALLLAGLPLLILADRARARLSVVAALVLIGGAMLLTFSRGAVLGAVCGLVVIAGLAALARERRSSLLAAGTAAALVLSTVGLQVAAALPAARLTADGEDGFYGAAYDVPAEIHLAAGGTATVAVGVTNTGTAAWTVDGDTPFALGYHWLDSQTGAVAVLDGVRSRLPSAIQPGERSAIDAQVLAPRDPGEYQLAWDVVREGVTWFSEKGVPSGASTVVVSAVGGTGLASPVDDPTAEGGTVLVWPDLVPVPERIELWRAASELVSRHPLWGIGPGTFRLVYGEVLGWERWDQRIHSNQLYLELAATTGLLGLALFLYVVGASVLPALRSLLHRPWAIRAGLVGAIVAFLVHGLVDYFLGFGPTGVLFWALLGMTLGLGATSRATLAEARTEAGLPSAGARA